MMKLEESIIIEAPPEKVWPFLIDPEKIRTWYFPLEEFEFTSKQHAGEGATFYYIEKAPIGNIRVNFKVTEWAENQRIAFTMTSGDLLKWDNQSWTVEPADSGSKFVFFEEAGLPYGILGQFLGLFARIGSQANLKKMLANLKEMAEST
jgi:uncharacterized protein YndB with AHSA1/START domain